ECSENVLLQSAKRLWTRASLNAWNDRDYLNTVPAQRTTSQFAACLAVEYRLLDHSVGADKDCRRNCDRKRGRRLKIERQDETCRLLDRQIGGMRALQNRIGECRGAPVALIKIGAERQQAAILRLGREGMDGRKTADKRGHCHLFPPSEHHVVAHEYCGLRA